MTIYGQELNSAPSFASQLGVSHSLRFIITIVILTFFLGLFVGLVAENSGRILLPCLSTDILLGEHHHNIIVSTSQAL